MSDSFDNTPSAGEQFALSSAGELAWRQEVASRLDSYRVRRKRPVQQRSMALDFEPPVTVEAQRPERRVPAALRNLPPEPGQVPEEFTSAGESQGDDPSPETLQPSAEVPLRSDPRGQRDGNVLQFPRLALCPVFCEELAEPVEQGPRILDVPEELNLAAPPIVDIGLAPLHDPAALPEDLEAELPLPVASAGRRALAGLIDLLVVIGSSALFLSLLAHWGVELAEPRLRLALGISVSALFWVLYQYLFLVYSGETPGMQVMRLRLEVAGRGRTSRSHRQWRVLGMLVSYFPLGLGVAWALFDEDGLGWHDRISRTYLRLGDPAPQSGSQQVPQPAQD
jgi:uncharacterized RDD family membrane protein YckC